MATNRALSPSPMTDLSADLVALAERVRPSVVLIRSRNGSGSGTIWREDGQIITNSHVVAGERAEVVLADGRSFMGTLKKRDGRRDLALLQADASGLPAAALGDSVHLRPGQMILAIGNPLGRRGAVTVGVISSAELRFAHRPQREMADVPPSSSSGLEFIRASIQLAPGNSGGPLVDTEGHVLGINARVAAPRLALAIPSHSVQRFLHAEDASGVRLGIGAGEVELPLSMREKLGLREPIGIMVMHLVQGGLAEQAELFLGDIILALNGHTLPSLGELLERLDGHPVHQALQLRILRGDRLLDLMVPPPLSRAA